VYVSPEFRRLGIGKALIKAVAKIAAERQCGRLEWLALDWNKNALDFYRTLGMQVMDEWVLLRIKGDDLRRLTGS
jgi:ribosomal protein S18 acetylase RimI-like enzyme